MKKSIVLLALFINLCCITSLNAQSVGYTDAFPSLPAFSFPVEMVHAGDGSNRLFVVEKAGRIRVFQNQNNVTSYSTFLDITDRVVLSSPPNSDERGLLGLAFHPNYATNRLFYVYYTRDTVISGVGTRMKMILARFQASASNPNQALPGSEYRILQFVKNQNNTNHNGGKIAFGTDGFLYISVGDGGGGGDPQNNAQNVNNLFGKLLRIDVSGDDFPSDDERNYRIPPTNPFATGGGRPEIFAWGIRNMWKFSVDNVEGIIGGDVGQNAREEIDRVYLGRNYGWRFMEGDLPYNIPNPSDTNGLNLVPPIHVYPHSEGRSVTGGYVYRGSALPELVGRYIYGDYVFGRVWSLNLTTLTNTLLFTASGINIPSFGVDQNNELYFLGFNNGRIYRLTNTAPPPAGDPVPGIGLWSELGSGVNGTVRAIAVRGEEVFVGGAFTMAGSTPANNIAKWSAASGWSALGSGVSGTVQALAFDQDGNLLVGGAFSTAGGSAANNIARWNGSAWSALGAGVDAFVNAITILANGDVIAGGIFLNAGGSPANRIARWNGSAWSTLGAGVSGLVSALVSTGNTIYAGGAFLTAGGRFVNQLARWNGASWEALGHQAVGATGNVNALALSGKTLFAGGTASAFGGVPANNLARLQLPDAAEVRAVAAGNSSHTFAQTGVQIDFTAVANSGFVSVARYDSEPQNVSGIPQANVSTYRFVISQTSLGAFSALLRFNRTQIPNNGIVNPATVRVYRRPIPNTGTFSVLPNAFDANFPDEVRATTSLFSEFVLGGDADNPLPVELISFTGSRVTEGVQLNWTTASERNNAGFIVLRSSSSEAQPREIASYQFSPLLRGRGTTTTPTTYNFLDTSVETGLSYTYRLRSVDFDGTIHDYLRTLTLNVQPLHADEQPKKAYSYALMQNYPNPFNPTTTIQFSIPAVSDVKLEVFNILGQKVSTLVNRRMEAGLHTVNFNATNLTSGVYFYRLQSGSFVQTKKMMLIK
ncbi:MAG: PQQ-dependent sugar dehydrogenase [Candidatus Thermochlorobacter sp.]